MTQFKIGDEVIMTADSGKGRTFIGYKDGVNYEGTVIAINNDIITIELKTQAVWDFLLDGTGQSFPGMSIRPAKEKPFDILNGTNYINTHYMVIHKGEEKPITPSQWIEGQIPDDYRGWLWIWHHLYADPTTAKLVYSGDIIQPKRQEYTHWMPAELPPPPPVKEVEAYGYLEYMRMFFENSKSEGDAELAFDFYSKPATAEVLTKYLKSKHNHSSGFGHMTLDQFISWYKESYTDKLLFTPAAKDMLGIK